MLSGPIFLINGSPGSGKSTLSKALMQRFPKGVRISVDEVREWVVSGIAHPLEWTEETSRQFVLALLVACDAAKRYSEAGFAVAIDHCQHCAHIDQAVAALEMSGEWHKVLLLPGVDACLERNSTRTNKDFDYMVLEPIIRMLCGEFEQEAKIVDGWSVVDTSSQSIDESVDELLALCPTRRGS
jgi:tRNA uridine 5-carbamoylmethylation protein Kti12